MDTATLFPQLAPTASIPALQKGRADHRTLKRAMETKMKKYFLSAFALLLTGAFVLSITACNTVDGVGKDMQKGGKELSEEANEHKDKD
jgi:entericidin B